MNPSDAAPQRTPLYNLHLAHSGRMTSFAGYALPIQYANGIIAEHLHTRSSSGLFDVSHMGQIEVRPHSGKLSDAAVALERLTPADVAGIAPGRQRYALLTDNRGGVLDDLMIANLGDRLLLVVNAATKAADFARLRTALAESCEVTLLDDRALIALQGPLAERALGALAEECPRMRFMDAWEIELLGARCTVSRSGYTGEDGFEIGAPADRALDIAVALLDRPETAPAGLGARDSLRTEAGLCLYGTDLTPDITPVEAGLDWAIHRARRPGGDREGGFPGASVIFRQLAEGPARRRVGLRPVGRAPVRFGSPLFAQAEGGKPVGSVTSGCFGPSVGAPVAMGYVAASTASLDQLLFAEVRGARLPVHVAALPFHPPAFKR